MPGGHSGRICFHVHEPGAFFGQYKCFSQRRNGHPTRAVMIDPRLIDAIERAE